MGALIFDDSPQPAQKLEFDPPPPERTWSDVARGAILAAPQTVDDAVRAAANTVTFGMADRFAGYMGGTGTDAEAARSAAARERSPIASLGGDVAGSVALPGFGAAKLSAALAPRLGVLGGRAAGYGLTGAATGAAQGAGNTYTGELPDYVRNATVGGALGGVLGSAGGAVFGARPLVSKAETPTIPELRDFKTGAYDALNANPTPYDASHLARRANALENRFHTVDRYYDRDSPATFRALDEMRAPYEATVKSGDPAAIATVDPAGIDFIRKGINKIPPSAERAVDRESGRIVKQSLDDFLENPPPGAVLPGYEGAARDAAGQALLARESNAGYKRAVLSDAMRRNAENNAAANYSGLNLENNLRQEYRNLLAVDKKTGISGAQRAGYSPGEIARFQQFVSGKDTPGRNLLRWGAKTAGGGSGLGFLGAAGVSGVGAGYASDDPRWSGMLALPAAGVALRTAGNRIALRNVNNIDRLVRQNNPMFAGRAASAGMQPGPGSYPTAATGPRNAIALELMKQLQGGPTSDWEQ